MKIFITGGKGFIGSYLIDRLVRKNHDVASYDNLMNFSNNDAYYKQMLSYRKKYLKTEGVKFIHGDIRNIESLKKSMKLFKPEVIVHLAGLPMARPPKNHEQLMIPINMHGTLNVLEAFENTESAQKIIYTSSSMAYGHFRQSPQAENSLLFPTNTYGASKAAGEYFVKLSKKQWVIIRPTSVFGFTDCANRVSQLLLDAAIAGRPAWVVRGESLDFSYVEDVADGFVKCIASKKANGHTFNISRGQSRRATEYAEVVKQYFPKFSFDIKEPTITQVYRGALDIQLATTILNFKPKFGMEEGIEKTIHLMKQYGQIRKSLPDK